MKFPGRRNSKHYFPVEEKPRSSKDFFSSETSFGKFPFQDFKIGSEVEFDLRIVHEDQVEVINVSCWIIKHVNNDVASVGEDLTPALVPR